MNELSQLVHHPNSAHPFGGNEDLYSNWIGSQIGANGIIQNGHGDLGTQLTDYFESLGHGQIRGHQGQNPVDGLGGGMWLALFHHYDGIWQAGAGTHFAWR